MHQQYTHDGSAWELTDRLDRDIATNITTLIQFEEEEFDSDIDTKNNTYYTLGFVAHMTISLSTIRKICDEAGDLLRDIVFFLSRKSGMRLEVYLWYAASDVARRKPVVWAWPLSQALQKEPDLRHFHKNDRKIARAIIEAVYNSSDPVPDIHTSYRVVDDAYHLVFTGIKCVQHGFIEKLLDRYNQRIEDIVLCVGEDSEMRIVLRQYGTPMRVLVVDKRKGGVRKQAPVKRKWVEAREFTL